MDKSITFQILIHDLHKTENDDQTQLEILIKIRHVWKTSNFENLNSVQRIDLFRNHGALWAGWIQSPNLIRINCWV